MATNTASTGDLSQAGTWSLGHMPIATEDVVLPDGVAVTWDVGAGSRLPASGTLNSISGGSGSLQITPSTTGAVSIYATTYTAANGLLIALLGTSTNIVTLNGTTMYASTYANRGALVKMSNTAAVVNVSEILPSNTGNYASCAIINNGGTLVVNDCDVYGSDTSLSSAINSSGQCTFNNVNLIDGTRYVAYIGSSPIWNITGRANYHQRATVNLDGAGNAVVKFPVFPLQANVLLDTVIYDGFNGTLAAGGAVVGAFEGGAIWR